MSKRDYYEILEISKGAADDEIKSAYRKMAMKFHPDRNPGDSSAEDKFKEATEAYEVLKDSQKRQMYDQYGHEGLAGGGFGGGGFESGFGGFDLSDALRAFMRDFGGGGFGGFEDIFGGGGGGGRRQNRGEDLRAKIPVTLEEIATGCEKTLNVKALKACEDCNGSGVAPGSSKNTCADCRGAGQIRTMQRTFLGTIQQVKTCPKCRGTGETISSPCPQCRGEGRLRGTNKVKVKVPAGVSAGNYMTIEDQGNAPRNGGLPGNLQVVFDETDHDIFTRQGDNIVCQLPISFTLAALGGELEVPTLDGTHSVKIPSGTQSGKVFRLKGKGIPHLQSYGTGDELIQMAVWTPTKLSSSDKNTLKELGKLDSFRPPKANKSFFAKLKQTLGI